MTSTVQLPPAARAQPVPVPPMTVLLRRAAALSLPVMLEHVLHMIVGLTDTYMANHLKANAVEAGAAVGTIATFIWFIGLLVAAVGSGATAIIARAKGARHRSLANSVCGQAVAAAVILGLAGGAAIFLLVRPLIGLTGLHGLAADFAGNYLSLLSLSIPLTTLMLAANACLRGAGDTLTPAISMIVVDVVNIFFTYSLTVGAFGLPELGFRGIALGTVIAYTSGGVLLLTVLLAGWGGARLHLHRLRPDLHTLRRIFRIGIPTGFEGLLVWLAQFGVLHVINSLDPSNRVATAHNNAVRIEGLSYMVCFGVGMAAATLVGQALGARNVPLARRSAWACYLLGGGLMTFCAMLFILFGRGMAAIMSQDATVIDLTARCLFITAFCQPGFAAAIVFSGALRGAGDTLAVMLLNLASIFLVRLLGVLLVAHVIGGGLAAIWVVLTSDLFIRGTLMTVRFIHEGWARTKV
jgi:putative MATE family efflux protein